MPTSAVAVSHCPIDRFAPAKTYIPHISGTSENVSPRSPARSSSKCRVVCYSSRQQSHRRSRRDGRQGPGRDGNGPGSSRQGVISLTQVLGMELPEATATSVLFPRRSTGSIVECPCVLRGRPCPCAWRRCSEPGGAGPCAQTRRLRAAGQQDRPSSSSLIGSWLGKSRGRDEKRHTADALETRNDLLIWHPRSSNFMTDLPDANTPTAEQLALALDDVLVEDVHDPVIRTRSGVWVRSASRAKRTASAIAS